MVSLSYIQALLRAINNSGGREDIIEAAVCALRHITSRHPSAEDAQNAVRLQNGIPMLTNFMQQQCRWPLMQALLGKYHYVTWHYMAGVAPSAT